MRALWPFAALALFAIACASNQAAEDEPADAATPTATPTSTPAPEPTPTATATPDQRLDIVYIGGTGGDGVSLRDACHADARIDGAWAEGTPVRIITPGEGACAGWTYVVGPGVGSWVSDDHLTTTQPAAAAAPSGSGGGSTTSPPPAGPPAGAPMFLFGFASAGDFISVWAGDEFCDSTLAPSGGRWGLELGPGTECSPAAGAPLVFAVNGAGVKSADSHTFQPGGNEHVSLIIP